MPVEPQKPNPIYDNFVFNKKSVKTPNYALLEDPKLTYEFSSGDHPGAASFVWQELKPKSTPTEDDVKGHVANPSSGCSSGGSQKPLFQFILRTAGRDPEKFAIYESTNVSHLLEHLRTKFPMSDTQHEIMFAVLFDRKKKLLAEYRV